MAKFRDLEITWRTPVSDEELVLLTSSYGGQAVSGWWNRIRPHSLGWVTARLSDGSLIGFVNVAWDGGNHAFLLDTKIHRDYQRQGIGSAVVKVATERTREVGCEWLHVDFIEEHRSFYLNSCGFKPPQGAGLIHLYESEN